MKSETKDVKGHHPIVQRYWAGHATAEDTIAELEQLVIQESVNQVELRCEDCFLLYSKFGLDMVLPRGQWLAIHATDNGLLCANCIVRRAADLPGATVVRAVIEVQPVRLKL